MSHAPNTGNIHVGRPDYGEPRIRGAILYNVVMFGKCGPKSCEPQPPTSHFQFFQAMTNTYFEFAYWMNAELFMIRFHLNEKNVTFKGRNVTFADCEPQGRCEAFDDGSLYCWFNYRGPNYARRMMAARHKMENGERFLEGFDYEERRIKLVPIRGVREGVEWTDPDDVVNGLFGYPSPLTSMALSL